MTCFQISRSSAIDPNPQTLSQAIGVGLSSLTKRHPVTLVVTRRDGELRTLVFTGDSHEEKTGAIGLARALGGSAKEATDADYRNPGEQIARMRVHYRQTLQYGGTQAGVDPTSIVDQIDQIISEGSWLAIVARTPARYEKKAYSRYVTRIRPGQIQHYSKQSASPIIASVYAGSPDLDRAEMILDSLTTAWIGFDVETTFDRPSFGKSSLPWLALAVLGIAGILGLPQAGISLAASVTTGFKVAIGAGLIGAFATWRGWIPSLARTLSRTLLPPRHRIIPSYKGRKEGVNNEGEHIEARDPAYPLDTHAVLLSPIMAATPFAPQKGASTTFARDIPATMQQQVGPFVGRAGDASAYVCDEDLAGGLAVVGSPGAGKSVFLQSIAAYLFTEQARPSRRPKAPGKNNSVVIFEIKPDGARDYQTIHRAVAESCGAEPNPLWFIDMSNPHSADGINLFPNDLDPEQTAALMTDSLVYASAEGEIGSASREALMHTLRAAQYVDDEVLHNASGAKGASPEAFVAGKSFVYYAYTLLGGDGDEAGQILAAALRDKLLAGDIEMKSAARKLENLYGKVTPAQRRDASKAPRNKLARLVQLDHLFSRTTASGKAKPPWTFILDGFQNVILLTGTSLSEDQESLISAIFTYTLQRTVQEHCAGWEAQGKYCTQIYDELSVIGKNSPYVLDWNRNKGRSYGVRPIYATQNPGQIDMQLRRTLLTFPVFASFKADEVSIATEVATKLAGDGSHWESKDLINLPRYTAVISANFHGQSQPAFNIVTEYWKNNPDRFIRRNFTDGLRVN